MEIRDAIDLVARAVDVAGVAAVAGGIAWVTLSTVPLIGRRSSEELFRGYRRGVGKAILLGLELLVAADIIRMVAIRPTLEGVAVLGLIVVIRTFLSFSLQVELSGRWPWQRAGEPDDADVVTEEPERSAALARPGADARR